MRRSKPKRIVDIKVLPGEPLDGTGKVCIHLFIQDEHGSFVEPHVLHPATTKSGEPIKGQLVARPTRGRLACNRLRDPRPICKGVVTTVTLRTDDPRAVTCPKCIASKEYQERLALLNQPE